MGDDEKKSNVWKEIMKTKDKFIGNFYVKSFIIKKFIKCFKKCRSKAYIT